MRFLTKLFVFTLVALLVGCSHQSSEDAVERVARRFGVPRQRVIDVIETIGVQPDAIETFGPYYFPYNYYKYQIEAFEHEQGRPPRRSDVERLMKGYVAKCEITEDIFDYIYYSTHAHYGPLRSGEIAMVIEVHFDMPFPGTPAPDNDDPLYISIRPVELWDDSVNPPDETYWGRCIEEYIQKHQP